ncbi:MAG: exosome complex exonuclease Rrp41 [Candidatus Altiarchaeales archaeon HGW-Altiarchaeales-3]|nr:MAG: exosome complex exonuclease Rrp41 [Candidatus Altiarchaeales archaeon HGW-Altiarchaeales-3]
MTEEIKLIDENGIRLDGRKPDELRKAEMKVGVLKRADGSAYVKWGNNIAIAAVYGPKECHPQWQRDSRKAVLRCVYNMAPFSVDDRKRPGPDRRSSEISKVITEALSSVVLLENYPSTAIDVFIEILQADAGTRCVGLTAASLALADAGIPMKDIVPACAAGKAGGEIIVDLMKEEDNKGEADLPIAIIPRTGEIALMQLDGDLTKEEFVKAYDMACEGAMKISEIQKQALLSEYEN